jgi:hypothetical protein
VTSCYLKSPESKVLYEHTEDMECGDVRKFPFAFSDRQGDLINDPVLMRRFISKLTHVGKKQSRRYVVKAAYGHFYVIRTH